MGRFVFATLSWPVTFSADMGLSARVAVCHSDPSFTVVKEKLRIHDRPQLLRRVRAVH